MKQFFKAFFITILVIFLLGTVGVAAYVGKTIVSAPKINPKGIYSTISANSYIYDKDGNLISSLNYGEDREIVKISDMPSNLKGAFISIEDKTFYKHHGFNFKRMVGAVWSAIKGDGEISGTSTITQQLARNVFLPEIKSERSIKRKIIEMWYALQIEQELSKDEILEAYLNVIYLGYGSYGVGTAADTYFSKEVKDLTLEECAALAALPQAPDTYALLAEEGEKKIKKKVYSNDISKDRRFLVLDLMAERGYISQEKADAAKTDLETFINPNLEKLSSINTYFCDYVIERVIDDLVTEMEITEERARNLVYTGGLTIKTTLDSDIQQVIYDEFQDDSNFPYSEEEPEAAMVVVENGTGKVVAMMGGRTTSGEKLFNRAVNPRQPGSSIKPISVYGTALQKSFEFQDAGKKFDFVATDHDRQGATGWGDYITASSTVRDERMYFDGQLWPLNATRSFSGYRTVRTALQQSINTCAVKILIQTGVDYSIETTKRFGISTLVENEDVSDENLAAMALGAMTNGVTPLEMALAYSVFPSGGKLYSDVCYTTVSDKDGNVLLDGKAKETDVIDAGVAYIMTDMLQSVVTRGLGYNARISGVDVGGKTGTTNDNYDIWFDGFTPKYSAALWIGTDHNTTMPGSSSSQTAWLWSEIMGQMSNEGEYPEMPSDVVRKNGEYYTKGTEPYYVPRTTTRKKTENSNSSSSEPVVNEGTEEMFIPIE